MTGWIDPNTTFVSDENSHPFKTSMCVKLSTRPVIYARIDFFDPHNG